jgi:PST family polysaccharide transporter
VRILGLERYGLVNFAQSFIAYFVLLADYGFNYSANREVSIHRDDNLMVSKIFSSVMLIKFAISVLGFAIASVIIKSVPKLQSDSLLYYATFLFVFGTVLFPDWFFQGMEKMRYITILNALSRLIFTICMFLVIKRPQDYLRVPLLNFLGQFVAGLVGLYIALSRYRIRLVIPNLNDTRLRLAEGWHVFVSTIAISAYSNTRLFIVGLMTNNLLTGFYAIAEKLLGFMQSACLIPLVQTVYPRLSRIYSQDRAKSLRVMRALQAYTTAAYLVFLPVIFIIAPGLISLIARQPYPEAVLAFRLLLVAIFFTSANAFRVQFLLVSGRRRAFANIHLLAGAAGITLTYIFTRWFSYLGPAIALIPVELAVLLLTLKAVNESEVARI